MFSTLSHSLALGAILNQATAQLLPNSGEAVANTMSCEQCVMGEHKFCAEKSAFFHSFADGDITWGTETKCCSAGTSDADCGSGLSDPICTSRWDSKPMQLLSCPHNASKCSSDLLFPEGSPNANLNLGGVEPGEVCNFVTISERYPTFSLIGDFSDMEIIFTEMNMDGVGSDPEFSYMPSPSVEVNEVPRDYCTSTILGYCAFPDSSIPRIYEGEEVTYRDIENQMYQY